MNVKFVYVAAVRKEIQDETDRETGRTKQISSVPIHLSIYSPNGNSVASLLMCHTTLLDIVSSLLIPLNSLQFLNFFYDFWNLDSCQLNAY